MSVESELPRHAGEFLPAYQLVGEFMWHWSTLERALDRAVASVLSLSLLEAAIVTANLQVRDKIHTARTAIDLFGPTNTEFTAQTKRLFDKIAKAATDRNLVAHNYFTPEKDGVAFSLTRAKGSLSLDDVVWRGDDFRAKFSKLHRLADQLEAVVEATREYKARYQAQPGGSFSALFRPMTQPPEEGILSPQILRALSGLDSDQPVEPTDDQPPEPKPE